ncbi:MAG: BPSS1187 family protein [Akkermansiaceae bacterium]|nr:hypothetical protein [Akkermansiaceae bacterium]
MIKRVFFFLLLSLFGLAEGEHYKIQARASKIDPGAKSYPEIGFVLKSSSGKPQDFQHASVDTRVTSRGRLAIWLMAPNQSLFDRLNSYGIHAIQVHYARQWFSKCCQQRPVSEDCRGDMRLEAATGEDHSEEADIMVRDSIKGRALRFIKYLEKVNPEGRWGQFLTPNKDDIIWERVILTGASHGSTTASRLAKHTKVARVVALCGPRDQYQTWQALPSKTPNNRFFGFSHTQDMGWVEFHYQRSWEMLGLHQFGPIIDVDESKPPYANTRRLITNFDVKNDANRAHSSVTPGSRSYRGKDGNLRHDPVWRYLYTHPVDKIGQSTRSTRALKKIKPQKVK